MSTAAIITMILIQGSVTAVTVYIFYLILKPNRKNTDKNQNGE